MRTLLLLALLSLPACAGRGTPAGPGAPELRDPPRAVDLNPAAGIVEINLTAAPIQHEFIAGQPTTIMAYNGSIPGPLIECTAGDELVVHFTNELSEATTVHWHGVRLPADMDGSHLSQTPVEPGATFTYHFVVPDASLFWYHPHHMGQDQLYRGLYGPLLVRAAEEVPSTRDRVLVLSDIGLTAGGQLIPPMELVASQRERAMGIEGNTLLVNGQAGPQLRVRRGGRERWRIVNAAGARYFNLALPSLGFRVIGSDGGLLNAPVAVDTLLLSPGERADVLVDMPDAAGTALQLLALDYQRLLLAPHDAEERVLAELVTISPAAAKPPLPQQWGTVPSLTSSLPQRNFVLNARLVPPPDSEPGGMPGMGQADFLINGRMYPDVPSFSVPHGSVELWSIENHSQMDHPFHIHGMRFQVVGTDGAPPAYGGWRDTVNLPTNPAAPTVTQLLVSFDGFPGKWVYHCHILFHQEQGMMADFEVR